MGRPTSTDQLSCNFCGKKQGDVFKLIAGPKVFICNECVDLCNDIIAEEPLEGARDTRSEIQSPKTPLRILDRAAASHVPDLLCGGCSKVRASDRLVFAAAETATPAESGSMSHAITADEMQGAPRPLCLQCAQRLILSSLEKRECSLCHKSRFVSEFPDPEWRVCTRCAQTAMWLLEHRESEPDVLIAMHALLEGGMHALFDHVVRVAKYGKLHRLEFESAALQVLRHVGLVPRGECSVPEATVGFIAESCHTDGVWLRVESARVPEANISFTAQTL